jgi:polysaccharide export outer membrane protein
MKNIYLILFFLILQSCGSKKNTLYLQNEGAIDTAQIEMQAITIQPNDILKILVGSIMPEAAMPYNRLGDRTGIVNSLDILKLEGYVVSNGQTITFPILGVISVAGKTMQQLAAELKKQLQDGGHLVNPTVDVRLLNSKFTVLGEVMRPGTFTYTDNNLSLLQALGMAGDLTLNAQRDDMLLIREVDGKRKISHINLMEADYLSSDSYQIRPNDVIVVNPNTRAVNLSGLIDIRTMLTIASLALSMAVLLTR